MFIQRARLKKTNYLGSACSGSDGAVNRTLTHTKALLSDSLVMNGRSTLINGVGKDYTVSGAVITFLGNVFDTDEIVVYS